MRMSPDGDEGPAPSARREKGVSAVSKYRPPYGVFDLMFSGKRETDRMIKANENYRRGYYYGKGSRDGRSR